MIIAWIPLLKYRINEICCGARLPGCSAGKLRVPWLSGLQIDLKMRTRSSVERIFSKFTL